MAQKHTDADYDRVKQKYVTLKRAISNWVLADYEFRLGPHSFDNRQTKSLAQAEEDLRQTISDSSDLREAAHTIDPDLVERERAMVKRVRRAPENDESVGEAMTRGEPKPKKLRSLFAKD